MNKLLHRINPEKNEFRYYQLSVGPSLLDEWAVTRYWGRIGGRQRGLITPCASDTEAEALAGRLLRKRLRHGYRIIKG